jgi:Protein of unknown function (DUF3574)
MKYFLAVVLLMMSFVVQTSYAQQPVSLASATEIVETESFIRTELFFGRNKPDGTEVSQEEFADFLSVTITPEFPDGLTVLDGIGQFRDSNKNIIQEKSKVLILLYPSNTRRQSSRKIERIRTVYKERFQQQSVLRVDDILPVKISF